MKYALPLLLLLLTTQPTLADDHDGDGVPAPRDPHPLVAGPAAWYQIERLELLGEGGAPVALAPRTADERRDWPGAPDGGTADLFALPRAVLAKAGAREMGLPSDPVDWADAVSKAPARIRQTREVRVAIRLVNPTHRRLDWNVRDAALLDGPATPSSPLLAELWHGRWRLAPRSQMVVRVDSLLSAAQRDRLLACTRWPTLGVADEAGLGSRARLIQHATAPVTIAIPGRELSWRVARRDGRGPLTAGRALEAALATLPAGRPYLRWSGDALRALAGRESVVDQRWWRVQLGGKPVTDRDWRGQQLPEGGLELRYVHRRRAEGVTLAGRRYERAAESGDRWAATVLGVCLRNGYGLARDREAAVRWWRAAADTSPGACVRLGRAHLSGGGGVAKSRDDAAAWFAKAAESGHLDGMRYHARLLIARGQPDEAARWLRKAAERGHAQAQMELGVCYLQGVGVAKDDTQAFRWFRAAAHEGLIRARSSWGWCLVNGRGTPVDRAFGLALLRRSASQGCAYARRVLRAQGELPR